MTLFAFALAEMVKIERRERLAAQNDSLQAKQALLDNLRAQESLLERTIEERTRELNIALRKEREVLSQYVRFGSLISHEFRNPLGVINSQATLLRKEQGLNEKGVERVSTIKTAVRRLVKLFDKWLEGDRLETLMQRDMTVVKLTAIPWVEQLLKKNGNLFEDHDIVLAPKDTDISVHADPDMLEIAILNLLENACKYSSPGSKIIISAVSDHQFSGISVTDEGIGISESHQAEIFDDYVRIENPSQPGLGLGLAFVKRIMQAHAGHVSVTSAPGLGSSFTLFFPQPRHRQ
jgi:signal transduction histidine kinase